MSLLRFLFWLFVVSACRPSLFMVVRCSLLFALYVGVWRFVVVCCALVYSVVDCTSLLVRCCLLLFVVGCCWAWSDGCRLWCAVACRVSFVVVTCFCLWLRCVVRWCC